MSTTRKSTTTARKAPAKAKATKAPARKAPAKATKAPAKSVKVGVTLDGKTRVELSDPTAKQLVKLQAAVVAATEAFETAVVEQLRAGVSPTHVAQALDIANSSVRRIGWRHGVGEPPAAQRKAIVHDAKSDS
jgi:hypothetical protein